MFSAADALRETEGAPEVCFKTVMKKRSHNE
jgi:hypothetical protein